MGLTSHPHMEEPFCGWPMQHQMEVPSTPMGSTPHSSHHTQHLVPIHENSQSLDLHHVPFWRALSISIEPPWYPRAPKLSFTKNPANAPSGGIPMVLKASTSPLPWNTINAIGWSLPIRPKQNGSPTQSIYTHKKPLSRT
jgi:hypothetical protein